VRKLANWLMRIRITDNSRIIANAIICRDAEKYSFSIVFLPVAILFMSDNADIIAL